MRFVKVLPIVVSAVAALFQVSTASAATVTLTPSSGSIVIGDFVDVQVRLDTQSAGAWGADVVVSYNAQDLEVQDMDAGTSGTQVTMGTLFPQTNVNRANSGSIELSQSFSFGSTSTYNGTGTLATIRFRALRTATSSLTPTATVVDPIPGPPELSTTVSGTTITINSAPATFAYTLSASPSAASVVQGQTSNVTVTITRTSGTAQSVTLGSSGLPSGVTANTPSCTPNGGASSNTCSVTLTLTASASAAVITNDAYTLSGTPASGTANATVSVTAAPFAYTISASPAAASITQGQTSNITVTITRTSGTAQAVTLASTGLPSGVTANAPSCTPNGGAGGASCAMTLILTATGTAPVITNDAYTLSGTPASGTANVTVSVTAAAFDYTIGASPAAASVAQGQTSNVTVTITRTSGAAQAVTLGTSGLPTGVTANAPSCTPNGGASSNSCSMTLILTASASAPVITNDAYNITASPGSKSFAATVSVTSNAFDYTMSASPTAATIVRGSFASVAVTITRTSGTAQAVTVGTTGLPTGASSNSPSCTPNGGALGNSCTATLQISASSSSPLINNDAYTITGTPGSKTVTVSTTVTIVGPFDFTVGATPVAASVAQGSSTNVTVTVTRTSGLAQSVTVVANGLPTGVTANSGSCSPNGGASGMSCTVTLALTASASAPLIANDAYVISDSTGARSAAATVSVTSQAVLPSFATQPQSATVTEGNGASFAATANGTPAPTLQWQRAEVAAPDSWSNIAGGVGTTLALSNVSMSENGVRFRVLATNSAGSVASNVAMLTVNPQDVDTDGDGIVDRLDNCDDVQNPDQADADGDQIGNLCDADAEDGSTASLDFDGDGVSDLAVYRSTSKGLVFEWVSSINGARSTAKLGTNFSVPAVGDYDGDGRADAAVITPLGGKSNKAANLEWQARLSTTGKIAKRNFGKSTDRLLTGCNFDLTPDTELALVKKGKVSVRKLRGGSTANYSIPGITAATPLLGCGDVTGDGIAEVIVAQFSAASTPFGVKVKATSPVFDPKRWVKSARGAVSYLVNAQFVTAYELNGNAISIPAPAALREVVVADFDSDGKTNLGVISRDTIGGLTLDFFNQGASTPSETIGLPSYKAVTVGKVRAENGFRRNTVSISRSDNASIEQLLFPESDFEGIGEEARRSYQLLKGTYSYTGK